MVRRRFPPLTLQVLEHVTPAVLGALGDTVCGTTVDILFLSISDVVYRGGSIYARRGPAELFWIALSFLMVGVLLLRMQLPEQHGVGNIGFESAAVRLLYVGGVLTLILTGGLQHG
ncbi:MAG: cation:H+ antiporter [Glaciecola sp.]|jgi:cation:H+ antiporter